MNFGPCSLPQTHVNKVFPGTGTDGLSGATMSFDTVMENAALLRSAVSPEMMSGNLFWSHCSFKTNDRLMDRRHWDNVCKSQHSKSKNKRERPDFHPSDHPLQVLPPTSTHRKRRVTVFLFKVGAFQVHILEELKLVGVWCLNCLKNPQQHLHSNSVLHVVWK